MKKSILYLGIALMAFSNVSVASTVNPNTIQRELSLLYGRTTPLCLAISKGENEFAKKIIEYGANFNEKSNGMTPLMVAARYNNAEIIKYLIDKGVNVNEKCEKGYTAYKYAEMSKANDAMALLKS